MRHSFWPLAAWKRHQCTRADWNDMQEHVYQKPVTYVDEHGIWLKYGQQPAELHWSSDWPCSSEIVLMCVSKPLSITLNICYTYMFLRLRNYRDFWSLRYCCYEQNDICFVSQGKVRTAVSRGGQFCCSFVANLLQYLCAKNYLGTMRFDKVIAKGCNFLLHSVIIITRSAFGKAHLPPTTVFRRLKTTRRCFDGRPIPVRGIFPT